MSKWLNRVKLKHLMTEDESYDAVKESMNSIADVIDHAPEFHSFSTKDFRKIPTGDEYFQPVHYANEMINRMYDFADSHRIWIE